MTLTDKTNEELIQIIFRKDEIERQNNENIKTLKKQIESMSTDIANMEICISNYQKALDDSATEKTILSRKFNILAIFSILITIGVIITLFCL